MTARELALQILPLISVRSLETPANPLNDVKLSDGDVDAVAIAITQGIEEIFALGPTALCEQRYSTTLMPPTNVSFTATQYSTTISAFSGWQSWMIGCTIQGGDGEDNELLSATELLRPYQAGSGTASCTVYGDAVKLPSWVKNTMDPVETPLIPRLDPVTDREAFRYYGSPYAGDPQTRRFGPAFYYNNRSKTSGNPLVYFVDSRFDPTTGELPLFLRVNPMPQGATPITFRVKRKPPIVTAADIVGTTVTVTGTLSPNATGVYEQAGTFTGAPFYIDGTNTYILFFSGANWTLQLLTGSLNIQTNCWNLTTSSTNPAGTYTPGGAHTGTATITLSGNTDLVIPTDWHQSILLPFAKRWFMSHPAFNNPSAAANIMQQYQVAKQTLESFIPQITPTQGHYPQI